MEKQNRKKDLGESLMNLVTDFYLWYEFDYDISAIGASTPFYWLTDIENENKKINNKKIRDNLEKRLNKIKEELRLGGLNPNLKNLQEESSELFRYYITNKLVKKEKYLETFDKIKNIKKEVENFPKDIKNKLAILREGYKGQKYKLN